MHSVFHPINLPSFPDFIFQKTRLCILSIVHILSSLCCVVNNSPKSVFLILVIFSLLKVPILYIVLRLYFFWVNTILLNTILHVFLIFSFWTFHSIPMYKDTTTYLDFSHYEHLECFLYYFYSEQCFFNILVYVSYCTWTKLILSINLGAELVSSQICNVWL